jgi:hypothetical protein
MLVVGVLFGEKQFHGAQFNHEVTKARRKSCFILSLATICEIAS